MMMDQVAKALEHCDCVIGIYAGLTGAFDTVNHSMIIEKSYHYIYQGQNSGVV